MEKLLVYADFDWLNEIELIGELTMDSIRGGETYGFEYAKKWLHGFLLTSQGWTLSPAYDLNPSLMREQSLLINAYTAEANLNILLESSENYLVSKDIAEQIINDVKQAMASWRRIATSVGLPQFEQNMFADRFAL